LKNLPLPLFAKEGFIPSLWQREVRRDFVIDVFILMTLLVTIIHKKFSEGIFEDNFQRSYYIAKGEKIYAINP